MRILLQFHVKSEVFKLSLKMHLQTNINFSPIVKNGRRENRPVQDPIVMQVRDGPQELQHEAFDFSGQKDLLLLSHGVHQRLEVVLNKVHH